MLDKSPSRGATTRTQDQLQRQARILRAWALTVLIPVAVIGAALSFQSLYRAAEPVFGARLALGFPLLVDFLILGASLQYVAGAKTGRPRAGWRWTAHAGVAGTLLLNAMAAHTVREVPWHVTAPAVWSVLVELTAREVLGQWRAIHAPLGDRIPLRLWLTAPIESTRTWLRIARRVEGEQAQARLDVGVHAAAVEALKIAIPQRRARRVRRILQRQLRAGSLPPAAILGPLGWIDTVDALTEVTPHAVLRAALRDTLRGFSQTSNKEDTSEPDNGQETPVLTAAPSPPPVRNETSPAKKGSTGVRGARSKTKALTLKTSTDPAGTALSATAAQPEEHVIDLGRSPVPADASPLQAAPVEQGAITAATEEPSAAASTGDRFSDAIDIVRVHESITAAQLATQLRGLGWQLSNRTASRILNEVRDHLRQLDPWALPTP